MENKEDELVGFNENLEENEIISAQNNSCSKKDKIFIFLFISVLIIVAAIIILYFFYLKEDNEYKDEDNLLKNYSFKAKYYTEENNTNGSLGRASDEVLEMNID